MPNPKKMLIATDFSLHSDHAVKYGMDLARRLEADVYLAHVCEPPSTVPELVNVESLVLDEIERAAQRRLRALIDDLRDRPKVVEPRVEVGDPRRQLLRLATTLGVELIVIGTHGRRGIPRMVLGSVAEHVVRTAPCPVLVVRRPNSHVELRS